MKKKLNSFLLLLLLAFNSSAQYSPAAGKIGTTALHKDSSIFINWASNCSIKRGWKNISQKDSGLTTIGDSLSAIGMAGQNGVVSLGDSGIAILKFNNPIIDGKGWDFAVFENSFDDRYLELAFVEVSSNGWRYFRFPCHSLSDTLLQTQAFGYTEPENINNLAGKYRGGYGTPFDIGSLPDYKDLDKKNIQYIKIIDVVGSLNSKYASYDTANRKINDPWPTPFNSSGFDLDAVGVIYEKSSSGLITLDNQLTIVGPNPLKENQNLLIKNANKNKIGASIYNMYGQLYSEIEIDQSNATIDSVLLPFGSFYIKLNSDVSYIYNGIKLK